MTPKVFIDTETTSLHPNRRIWDVGLIVRDGDTQTQYQWFIEYGDLDLGNADPFSLRVGKFYERHPGAAPWAGGIPCLAGVTSEAEVMHSLEYLTRGAHLIGAVVSFDAEGIAARMRAHGIAPS